MTSTSKNILSNPIPLLEAKEFSLTFRRFEKGLQETELEIIRNLNLSIYPGEIVAILGASGSGKSLLANAILGILPENAVVKGTLSYKGEALTEKRQIALRGKEISLIPQSVNALDPLMKTGRQVQVMAKGKNKQAVQQNVFREVGLDESAGSLYPFELSGGMARRVLAATAMVSGAQLVIADEPTPGLDPAALHETLKHMKKLSLNGKGMMFITHDIEVALKIADKIAVLHEGETVEIASTGDFSGKGERLRHPYTRALWNALPQNGFHLSGNKPKTSMQNLKMMDVLPPSSLPNLEVKNLGYRYTDSDWLFKDISLTVRPGEIVGLFGYSGSGKSTAAQIICGYKQPLKGKMMIGGRPVSKSGACPVQLVWQHPEKAINPKWRMKRIFQETGGLDKDIMDFLGIKESWLNRWPRELSGGELQRFSLARALSAQDVKYLVLDEMTTMLDAITQAQIWQDVLKWAKARNIGVLVISHDHHLLDRVSDRILDFSEMKENEV